MSSEKKLDFAAFKQTAYNPERIQRVPARLNMRNAAKRSLHASLSILLSAWLGAAPVVAQDSPYFRWNVFGAGTQQTTSPTPPTPPTTPNNAEMLVQINGPLSARVSESFSMTPTAINPPAGTLAWSMAEDSSPLPVGLGVDSSSGRISGTRSSPGLTPVLKIKASNPAKSASSAPFRILFRPAGATGTASMPVSSGRVGQGYNVAGSTADMDTPVVWALASGSLPPGLSLSSQGTLQGIPTTAGTYPGISFVVTGPTDAVVTPTYSITIQPPLTPTLGIASASITGNVGTYLKAGPRAFGGTAPYTYTLSSGTPPLGLAFNASTGEFEGIPAVAGTTNDLVVEARDATNASAVATVSIAIGAPLPFTLQAPSPTNGFVGSPMTVSVTPYNAQGAVAYALLAGNLPPGMAVSASDGAIRGTPTTTGTYGGIVIQGVDEANRAATTNVLTLVVAQPQPFYVNVPSGSAPFNTQRTFQATTTQAGTYSYAWDVDSVPTPPAGVSLNPSTGLITVQRNIGGSTGYLRIAATQTSGPNAGRTEKSNSFYYNIESTGTFEIVMPDEIGPATVGEPYSIAFAARGTGGTGPVTGPLVWSTTYTLPAGLTLNPETGRIEGTPTTATASWTWTRVKATDALGRTATTPDFWMRAANTPSIAWSTGSGKPEAGYKVRRSFLLRADFKNASPSLAKVETWAYRSWEASTANRRIVNHRAYMTGAGGLVYTTGIGSGSIDANFTKTRYSGQAGYAMGLFDTRISQVGDVNDMGSYTVTMNYEDARGKVAKTEPTTFNITGPLKLIDYVSNPAQDYNFTTNYVYGTCGYGATYVPAGTDGVEGLDEIRIVAVPNSRLSLDPVFENDPYNSAMPYFDQKPWPGGNNGVPELPGQAGAPGRHLALGLYGHGAGIPSTQAPGFYKNLVGIYDGEVDVYTYYNVKTLLNPAGGSCNTSSGAWNF